MAESRIFHGIGPATWLRMKATSEQEHGTLYDEGTHGSAVTQTPLGPIVIDFDFDAAQQTVAYTIVRRPFLVGENQIWDGIEKTITKSKSA